MKLESRNLLESNIVYDIIKNPFVKGFCDLIIATDISDNALVAICPDNSLPPNHWRRDAGSKKHISNALVNYRAGNPDAFNGLLIALDSSEFQLAVWREISAIPYGETINYSELAIRAGNPRAIRAAASACGKNPVPLIIPCHRVIGKNNSLGGFAWGVPYKKMLLKLEQN